MQIKFLLRFSRSLIDAWSSYKGLVLQTNVFKGVYAPTVYSDLRLQSSVYYKNVWYSCYYNLSQATGDDTFLLFHNDLIK